MSLNSSLYKKFFLNMLLTIGGIFFFWKSVGDDDDVPVFSDGGSGRGID